ARGPPSAELHGTPRPSARGAGVDLWGDVPHTRALSRECAPCEACDPPRVSNRPTEVCPSRSPGGTSLPPSSSLPPSQSVRAGRPPGVAGPLGTGTSPLQHSTYWTTPTAPPHQPAPGRPRRGRAPGPPQHRTTFTDEREDSTR